MPSLLACCEGSWCWLCHTAHCEPGRGKHACNLLCTIRKYKRAHILPRPFSGRPLTVRADLDDEQKNDVIGAMVRHAVKPGDVVIRCVFWCTNHIKHQSLRAARHAVEYCLRTVHGCWAHTGGLSEVQARQRYVQTCLTSAFSCTALMTDNEGTAPGLQALWSPPEP